jgi:UDP-glucose 4-epimerase
VTDKVLITGAGGFVGGHLWRYLGQQGYQVIACVTQKLHHHPDYGQVHLLRLPDHQLASILEHERPDGLVHCAGSSSPSQSILNPHQDFRDNVLATEALFEAIARNSPTTKVIFI